MSDSPNYQGIRDANGNPVNVRARSLRLNGGRNVIGGGRRSLTQSRTRSMSNVNVTTIRGERITGAEQRNRFQQSRERIANMRNPQTGRRFRRS